MRMLAPAVLLALALAPREAPAKDLRNRLAVGFDQRIGGPGTLTVRYGLPTADAAVNLQVEGSAGVDPAGRGYLGGRLLYAAVVEDNMNGYLTGAAGAGLSGSDFTGVLEPGLAVDFFPFGLENLGFTAGWSLALALGGDGGLAATTTLGVHYWF